MDTQAERTLSRATHRHQELIHTSCRSESSNISLVVLDNLLVSPDAPPGQLIVWAPFSAPTLNTCQTAPSEPQFCPLRLESNCSGCPDPARGCLQVLDKQKNRNLRQLCPDPSRPSDGRYRNCVSTSERQTTPDRPGKSKMLQQRDSRVI